jgi:hypothetical protein
MSSAMRFERGLSNDHHYGSDHRQHTHEHPETRPRLISFFALKSVTAVASIFGRP